MTSDGRDNLLVYLPVLFVDDVLPTLKDTELRVFLVVLRQTHVAGRERASVWITSGELRRRTGRASEAVSAAIDSLLKQGLLVIADENGKHLVTTFERQSASGRRFYSVSGGLFAKAKSTADKSKTIDINTNKHYSFRFSDLPSTDSDDVAMRVRQEKEKIRERLLKLTG